MMVTENWKDVTHFVSIVYCNGILSDIENPVKHAV